MSRIELTSPLALDACRDRLTAAMDDPWKWQRRHDVIGTVRHTRLRARKRIFYRNSFQMLLTAELTEQSGMTRLSCRFGMSPFVIAFIVIWCGFLGSAGLGTVGGIVLSLLAGEGVPDGLGLLALAPTGMMLFGIALMVVGRSIAGGERQFLLDFLGRTIEARPIDAAYSA